MKSTLFVPFIILSLSSFIYGAPVQGGIIPCLKQGNACAINTPQTPSTPTSAAIAESAVTGPASESGTASVNDTSTVQTVTVTVSACTAGTTETFSVGVATETATETQTTSGASDDETTAAFITRITVTETVVAGATATVTATSVDSNRKTGDSNSDNSTSFGTLESRADCPPDVNDATLNLLRQGEGLVTSPAPDPSGFETVGFGHKCQKPGCTEVPFPFPLTDATANQLLQLDVKSFTTCVNDAVSPNVRLNDNQFGALASFTFNLGCGAFKLSSLLKRLNTGEDPNTVASQEMIKFTKSKGKELKGLVNRRNAEIALFKTPSGVIAHPC